MRKFIRKVTKKGKYSYFVIIPKSILRLLGWRDRQKVVLRKYGKEKVLISDWKPSKKAKKK